MPLTLVSAVLVDDDAVVHVNAAAFEHLHRRLDADAHDDEVALETQARLWSRRSSLVGSFERRHGILEDGPNTVSAMKVGDGVADRLAQHAEERRFRRVDGDHVQSLLPERRRDLRTDEPHADDDGPAAGHDLCANAIGVLNCAETVDALEIAAGNRTRRLRPPVAMSRASNGIRR